MTFANKEAFAHYLSFSIFPLSFALPTRSSSSAANINSSHPNDLLKEENREENFLLDKILLVLLQISH